MRKVRTNQSSKGRPFSQGGGAWRTERACLVYAAGGPGPGLGLGVGLGAEIEHFMAGILHNMDALVALTAPSCNSFRRIMPQYGGSSPRTQPYYP
jgi:hypothetical protein